MIPSKYIDEFTNEHPIQAALLCIFGAAMVGYAIWSTVSP